MRPNLEIARTQKGGENLLLDLPRLLLFLI
jgi:hypothetical protein